MSIQTTIYVAAETRLTIVANEFTSGRYFRISEPGDNTQYPPVQISPGETVELGPFNEPRRYKLVSVTGELTHTLVFQGLDFVTADSVIEALSNASLELVSPANNDQILIKDSSDNGKLKAVTVQSLVDLVASGSGTAGTIAHTINQIAHGFSVSNVIALDNSGNYIKALADSPITSEVVGVVTDVIDSDSFTITTGGRISGLSGLVPGQIYFLSDVTAGLLSLSVPYLPDTVIKPVLIAESATTGFIQNYLGVHNG